MARLEVSISEKRFRSAQGADLIAIRDLNFNLEANKFTCIVGPSGCGKTTTLRIILGLDREFDGDITNLSQRRTAAVFQEPRYGQNSPERLAYLFRTLGLEDLLDFYPAELSLGLARRAALARAFAIQPNLLVLDEPFVSLDE